jgi:hypothetical protein
LCWTTLFDQSRVSKSTRGLAAAIEAAPAVPLALLRRTLSQRILPLALTAPPVPVFTSYVLFVA